MSLELHKSLVVRKQAAVKTGARPGFRPELELGGELRQVAVD